MINILGQVIFGIITILILFFVIGFAVDAANAILKYFGLSMEANTKIVDDDWNKEIEKKWMNKK